MDVETKEAPAADHPVRIGVSKEQRQNTRAVCKLIRESGATWEKRLPFLTWDTSFGLLLWCGCLGLMWWAASENYHGRLSAVALVLCSMLATSVLHEMEHDIIHSLWARHHDWLQHVFFLGIWVAKLGANPWFRKKLHLQHHTLSGQDDDAEERLIGLGLPMGIKRMAVTVHPMGPRK